LLRKIGLALLAVLAVLACFATSGGTIVGTKPASHQPWLFGEEGFFQTRKQEIVKRISPYEFVP
jgi:hypothetical protein